MKESDELGTTTLRPSQVAILLRLFAASVKQLYERVTAGAGASSSGGGSASIMGGSASAAKKPHVVGSATKSSVVVADSSDTMAAWNSLTEHIQREFPRLLTRFRDDNDNLKVLTQLLPFYDPSAFTAHSKGFKHCLQCVSDICSTNPGEDVLSQVCVALKAWLSTSQLNQASHEIVSQTVQDMLSGLRGRIDECLIDCTQLETAVAASASAAALAATESGSTSKGKRKSLGKGRLGASSDAQDQEQVLRGHVCLL